MYELIVNIEVFLTQFSFFAYLHILSKYFNKQKGCRKQRSPMIQLVAYQLVDHLFEIISYICLYV